MKLFDLAFACYLYTPLSDHDSSYSKFLEETSGSLDLNSSEHRQALLTWLNKWGCRQFAHKYHGIASEKLLAWYNEYNTTLFPSERNLWELTEPELTPIGTAYESLSNSTASYGTRKGNTFPISFGPTGAAKILFAIRPRGLLPWDRSIRDRLKYDRSQASYLSFLREVKSVLNELSLACQENGFQLTDLPHQLNRPNSTVPKLVDEYYWVTITNNLTPPDSDTFRRWTKWRY